MPQKSSRAILGARRALIVVDLERRGPGMLLQRERRANRAGAEGRERMKAETPNIMLSSTTFADSEASLKNTAYPRNPFINRIDEAFTLGRMAPSRSQSSKSEPNAGWANNQR